MRQRKFKAPPRKTLRRWRVPPALTHGDTDAFEGLSVLDEIPGELGIVLWQSLRDAMLWGRSNQADRGALFAEGAERARLAAVLTAGTPVEVEEPLKAVAAMLGTAGTAREENVALACREISQWAEARGLLATALAFSQSAAVVTPADPSASYTVGRLARRRAEHARAETWFRRTVALARQAGDWPTYALSFVGLANVYMLRGNFPAARRFNVRALRAAGRNSLHDIEGMALHGLFTMAGDSGNPGEATQLARRAFEAYGPLHPRLPHLAQDVAYFWCTYGCFAAALPVLQSVLKHFTEPADRLMVLGSIGRAAGGAGERGVFQQSWDEAVEMMGANGGLDTAARTYLDLAHGALSLGAWERAEDAAQRALDGATRRGDAQTRLTAEALVEAARRHQQAERAASAEGDAWRETADALATDFVHSLEA
jgi:tetratricopeptide (TPR) repeat protein